MKGKYIPFNDGYGIVGYGYLCPECNHETKFTDCQEGCKECKFYEPYVDPDEWYEKEFEKAI